VQRRTQLSLHTIRKLLAAVDVSVRPDLDQHHRFHRFIARTAIDYFMRRPLKKPLFVVFCLVFAIWPCSAGFMSVFLRCSLDGVSVWSPEPFWLRFAGGTGGMWLCFDIKSSLTAVAHRRSGNELREAGRVA
jgi:hypothetical protein